MKREELGSNLASRASIGWVTGYVLAHAMRSRAVARIEPRLASFDWQVTYEET